jgi:class 3 adenylate cyclase
MARRHGHSGALVAASVLVLVGLFVTRALDIERLYPGFFFTADYRVFPVAPDVRAAGLAPGDRIVAVDGASPLTLMARVNGGGPPVHYTVERGGRRFAVELVARPLKGTDLVRHFLGYFVVSAVMLLVGVLVFLQNPAATPNWNFLVYMCLWAVSNVAIADATLGFDKRSGALVGLLAPILSVHGWIFFLTYPVNRSREAWLERHRVVPRLYTGALGFGGAAAALFLVAYTVRPERLLNGWFYSASVGTLFALAAISFPIKIAALLETRRHAASPLVNQQATVLLLGIGFGLGSWLMLMLAPLNHFYVAPISPEAGSALVLLYPLAIAYATVRYQLFDATVVIRRSLVYTVLAGLVTGSYALAIASANILLARADLVRSPWFSAGFVFTVALVFHPLRERLRTLVDRVFFRERYDYARAIGTLARSMTSLLDLDEITRRVTTTVESAMHVRGVQLIPERPSGELVSVIDAVPGALSRYQVAADPRFREVAAWALERYAALGAEVLVPLRFQGQWRGLLVLGPKRSEAAYTAEDLALLETLADQAAVAVANAMAHRQLLEYARQLERSLLIRTNLAKFVPQRVRELIEESPEAPLLEKRETEVTVLFADITGYTRLAARLAQDTLDRLVEQYFGAFLDEVVKAGGDVNETAGDGLMVIFHEGDHARAAVAAAQAIHRRTRELNTELAGRFDPLAMHIGINTGPAMLGATKIEGRAGTRWTYTASGFTTNLAARLAAAAGSGEIVISEATRARLGPDAAVEDLGARPLKNVDTPHRLFRLREVDATATPAD